MRVGLYKATVRRGSIHLLKYQVAKSPFDARRRAVQYDDPIWKNARFKLVEPFHGSLAHCLRDGHWIPRNTIIVAG